ncbi:MAG: hypothetical protein ACI4ML_13235 [Aristaeellaceae bacterium]
MKREMCLLCTLLLAAGCTAAIAENSDVYGFSKGQQENEARHAVYAQLANHEATVDKSGYTDAHAQEGEAEAASLTVSDAEMLLEDGVIDQATLDRIVAYAADKHTNISSIYADVNGMSPAERNEAFAARKSSDSDTGDSVAELLEAGVITQVQADAMNAWLTK